VNANMENSDCRFGGVSPTPIPLAWKVTDHWPRSLDALWMATADVGCWKWLTFGDDQCAPRTPKPTDGADVQCGMILVS
jgi:hypothetical protein